MCLGAKLRERLLLKGFSECSFPELTAAHCYTAGILKAEVGCDFQLIALNPFPLPSREPWSSPLEHEIYLGQRRSSSSLPFDHGNRWRHRLPSQQAKLVSCRVKRWRHQFSLCKYQWDTLLGVGRVMSLRHIFLWCSNMKWESAGTPGHCLPSGKSNLNTPKTCLHGIWNRFSEHLRMQARF